MRALFLLFCGAILAIAALPYLVFVQRDMPAGTDEQSPVFNYAAARLLVDRTVWPDGAAGPRLEHEIFDTMLREIEAAETFLLLDFFLWNPWRGAIESSGELRELSGALADALIERRKAEPNLPILAITDPINRIYGDMAPEFFDRLAQAGIPVVFTDLSRLPDSNRIYAPQARFWGRILPQGGDGGDSGEGRIPNPFDPLGEKLRLEQLGRLLYFKANHRKVLVSGRRAGPNRVLVSSFNPADGSANHSNLGALVAGPVADVAARSELAVAGWSLEAPGRVHGGLDTEARRAMEAIRGRIETSFKAVDRAAPGTPGVSWHSEGGVERSLLDLLNAAGEGSRLDAAVFYYSDREVVEAMQAAVRRGAALRLLLDPNKDAFGREKNGIPNRPVAAAFMRMAADFPVEVRWAATQGEQFHAKAIRLAGPREDRLFLGSSNWTRRNLDNLNLEANLLFRDAPALSRRFDRYFESIWSNADGVTASLDYRVYAETGWTLRWKTWLYRFQEWSGASTF